MLRAHVPSRASQAAAGLLLFLLSAAVLRCAADELPPVPTCSKSCVIRNCDTIGMRYGKYCGLGWTGCPGEEPCDDLDDCCRHHDSCVEKKGLLDAKCHEKLKNCIIEVKDSGTAGFSEECPYERAMPIMIQGMDVSILLSKIGFMNTDL